MCRRMETDMGMIRFGLIGSGWRAEFYLRIAKAVPELFELTSVLIRDSEKGRIFSDKMDVPVVNTVDELIETKPDYLVLSVKRGITSKYLPVLFKRGIPVLCETPPGEDMKELESVWDNYKIYGGKIQIAEQYFAQPLYACLE